MNKNKQFAVIGLGRFGTSVTKTLIENGFEVMCCDKNMTVVKQMEPYVTKVVQADIMQDGVAESLGLNNFDVVVVAIGDSLESSVMATMYAKEAGVKTVIVKAKTISEKKILEKMGADKVIMPEVDSGKRLAISLTTTNVLEYISFSEKFAMAEIAPLKEWENKTLIEADIRAKYGFNVVAIKNGDDFMVSPSPQTIIKPGHILVIIGESKLIQKYN
ncbi:MAG: TrkA family potassium uptake protein [Clostridia bacterium]|nr:TrkA family potassium uptake protein [Clostridia bacterium]